MEIAMWPEIRENLMLLLEAGILLVVALEYFYDRNKDLEKKQKRTKTTKRVTKGASGETIEESTTETSEPFEMAEHHLEGINGGDKREGKNTGREEGKDSKGDER
jgi:hypothetical protein